MSKRTAVWLAWFTWALSVTLVVITIVFVTLDWSSRAKLMPTYPSSLMVFQSMLPIAFATVGAFIAARHYHNLIGWLFCAVGLYFGIAGFAEAYAIHALRLEPGSLPKGEIIAWVASWGGGPSVLFPFIVLFLLFPNGRLLSRRWRPVVWLALMGLGAHFFLWLVKPGPLQAFEFIDNPFGIDHLRSVIDRLEGPAFFLMLVSLLASAISLILRFRRSCGEERQQLKWLASAGALLAAMFAIGPFFWFNPVLPGRVWSVLTLLAFTATPVSVGIAILKYRLYDIDVIINRTLVYGTLTATLALVYVGSVVALQSSFRALTGQQSDLAIVASTLAIAALFNPLRRRIQAIIDRRFYRRKYDAAKTLQAFSARLRDEVDLQTLRNDLTTVVEETMQPAHVSLWLKPVERGHNG